MGLEVDRLCLNCMREAESDGKCPHCGHDNVHGNHNDISFLQPGDTIASRYIIGALKHKSGESAGYIGFDKEIGGAVWIKEYFPLKIAYRDLESGHVMPKAGCGAQYKALMSDYVDLCNAVRRLSVSDAVIPIEHVVSGNNTLYAVYKNLDVISLGSYLSTAQVKAVGGKIPVRRALKMFAPLFDTLCNMHARGDIHRGVSPSTVYIGRDGKLCLWGFALSASRTGESELDAELFDGYTAPEQYASNGWQGTWTDVYAIAALFYRTVTGINPPKSTLIGASKPLVPLGDLIEDIPAGVSDAVTNAMQPVKSRRTQTMAEFAAKMSVNENFADTAATAVFEISRAAMPQTSKTGERNGSQNSRKKDSEGGVSVKYVILALFCTVLILAVFMWYAMTHIFPDLIPGPDTSVSSQSESVSQSPSSELSSESESVSSSVPEDKSIPSFIGEAADIVSDDPLYENRFRFELRKEFDDVYDAGVVFDQSPPAGEIMQNKGTVILYVSKGKLEIEMPDLTDKTVEEAMEILDELSKEYNIDYLSFQSVEKYDSETEGGKIISSIPAAGMSFNPKTTQVIVYVSLNVEVSETKETSTSGRRSSSSSKAGWDNMP